MAALKQVLVTQLMAQDEGERLGRSAGSRLLRTTSLRTPVEHSSTRTPSRAQDYTSGDTGFYECPEDYGECVRPTRFVEIGWESLVTTSRSLSTVYIMSCLVK